MAKLLESAKENLSFLLVCLLIFLALFAVAKIVEKTCLKTLKEVTKTRRMAYIAIFGVIAAVLMYIEIPLPFAPNFYEIDFSEVPVLISTSFSPITPWQLPQHTLQLGFITMAPLSIKIWISPSSIAC